MSSEEPTGTPQLEIGPALLWAAIFLGGVVGIVILSSAWTTGGLPVHSGRGLFRGWASSIPLYLGFALPALLVLGVGALAARFRWGPVQPAPEETTEDDALASAPTGH